VAPYGTLSLLAPARLQLEEKDFNIRHQSIWGATKDLVNLRK
jgi:hypothetical protein